MNAKTDTQTIHLGTIVNGYLVNAAVSFSPAPKDGILSELARFEARRIFQRVIEEDIAAGRL